MNEIQINNETYIKKSSLKTEDYANSEIQIVVLNRGWIVVGSVSESDSKTFIQKASVIRRWGTEKGLGQLAKNGPLKETILDECPDIKVETINIVLTMNCCEEKWYEYSDGYGKGREEKWA